MVITRGIITRSRSRYEALNITSQVADVVASSGIKEGLAIVCTSHTTTGLFVNESESGLIQDIDKVLSQLVPSRGNYLHDRVDDNASSHIQSVLLSVSICLPVVDGKLSLGTWQSIFLAERDGPRQRSVLVTVIGQ